MITLEATIYVAMNGEFGCMPDSIFHCRTEKEAVDILTDIFDLGRSRRAELKRDHYLRLKPGDGAAYCDINPVQVTFIWMGNTWVTGDGVTIPLDHTADVEELVDYLLEWCARNR